MYGVADGRRGASYPSTHRLARELRLAEARTYLRDYLREVRDALSEHGCTVLSTTITLGSYLDARFSVEIAAGPRDRGEESSGSRCELVWAEDEGWSVSHPRFATGVTPWRYLHASLVPEPLEVVRFLLAAVSDTEDCMVYPARFRYRSEPLQPVIDQLARYNHHFPGDTPAADSARDRR